MTNYLTIGSTNEVSLVGLLDESKADGDALQYPTTATVTLTKIADAAGATVSGTTAIAMPYVYGLGAESVYRGIVPSTVTFVAGTYTATVTVLLGTSVRIFTLSCVARST